MGDACPLDPLPDMYRPTTVAKQSLRWRVDVESRPSKEQERRWEMRFGVRLYPANRCAYVTSRAMSAYACSGGVQTSSLNVEGGCCGKPHGDSKLTRVSLHAWKGTPASIPDSCPAIGTCTPMLSIFPVRRNCPLANARYVGV